MIKAFVAHVAVLISVAGIGYYFNHLLTKLLGVIEVPSFVLLYMVLFALSIQVYNSPKVKALYEKAKRKGNKEVQG